MTTDTAVGARASGTLAGTGPMLRFHLRRLRLYLVFWFLGLVGFMGMIGPALLDLYPDQAGRDAYAASLDSAAGLAMTGPRTYVEDYTAAAMIVHNSLLWVAGVFAVMMILLVVRLTRADEETSRLEVVRSQPVGRRSDLFSAVIVSVLVSALMAAAMALVLMPVEGVSAGQALLFGASVGACGLVFAAVTAVAAQLGSFASTSRGLAFAALGLSFLLVMSGNANEGAALWASPLGWSEATYVGTGEQQWWPLAVSAAVAVVLFAVAFALVAKRDFGQGMIAQRKGRAEAKASLKSVRALAFRLNRGLAIGAAVTMVLLASAYGSIWGDAQSFIDSMSETQREVLSQGQSDPLDGFALAILLVGSVAAMIFGIMAVGRARKEETEGGGEVLASLPVSRAQWPGVHYVVAQLIGTVAVVVFGLSVGAMAASTSGEDQWFEKLFTGSLIHLPAVWIVTALAYALYAWAPSLGFLRWLPLLLIFVLDYFGPLLDAPEWLLGLSPIHHVPSYPAEEVTWAPLAVLTLVAVALTVIGYLGARRRNLQFS
ncbi:ABC transporter permease [Salininema proteolyticum]|uniref:ABC transporter permease n=1 Tax=Salininema proteolyticum TaxID=1607685 RepID=A0ABV8TYX3_9ACTN